MYLPSVNNNYRFFLTALLVYSEAETAFHVAKSPLLGIRITLVQSLRFAEKYQFSRRFSKFNSQICSAVMHCLIVPLHSRAQYYTLRPQTGKYIAVQPETVGY